MASDWSQTEVEATVADYFDMLDCEVRGREFNKTAHRRRLASLLNQRTDGAIERKHQNISAILIELGFVYIAGYKPLVNYQHLLYEAVEHRLGRSKSLTDFVRQQMSEPLVSIPTLDDILTALVKAPTSDSVRSPHRYNRSSVKEPGRLRHGFDYLALEANNRSLGAAGEEFVLRFEVARLLHARHDRLAGKVERVSATRGDGLGYDVLSFETSGRERLIEVKTTNYGASTPFFVTRNELAVSRKESERFQLYRAYNFRQQPRLFCKAGAIEKAFSIEPSQYEARVS
ncbi:MAG: DUF3883 domain-containing protein [Rhodothermales bacterium]